MNEKESASKQDNNCEGTNEVVNDNCDLENLRIPKVLLKKEKRVTCPSNSSNDQKVPSMMKNSSGVNNNNGVKRSRQEPDEYNLNDCKSESEFSKLDDDLCSTAVSSSGSKKQATGNSSFCF